MLLFDQLTLDAPRRTKEGFLAVTARAARAGVYDYLGSEVDPDGKHFRANDVVKVYRPPEEVFDERSVGSFLMKPITVDHPSEPVTADNWGTLAKGAVARALRDGEHLNFDLVLMDAAAIADVDAGKRQLSNGYSCELDIGDGVTPDGIPFQATQRNIRGNHVAIVDRARAGPECRIGDNDRRKTQNGNAIVSDQHKETSSGDRRMPRIKIIDGLSVNLEDAGQVEIAFGKLEGQLKDAQEASGKLTVDLAAANTTIQTRDGEIVALKKQIEDAAITPAKLQQLADARAKVIAGAQALKPGIVVDGRTDVEIRKEAVEARLGDSAKDMTDAAIEGAFAALSKDAKPGVVTDSLRTALTGGITQVADAAAVRALARGMQYN